MRPRGTGRYSPLQEPPDSGFEPRVPSCTVIHHTDGTRSRTLHREPRMKGLGADVVELSRFERSLARSPDFAATVFTEGERAYCDTRHRPSLHLAARFAAKEAFLKAVGLGILDGLELSAIEVVRAESGRPTLRLGPAARRALESAGASTTHLSLSHDGDTAFAVVVIE